MSHRSTVTIDGSTVTIVGLAYGRVGFLYGTATWRIAVLDEQDPPGAFSVGLRASHASVLGQLRWMRELDPIRVVAELPDGIPPGATIVAKGTTDCADVFTFDWRLDSPDVELNVIQLEVIGKPVATVEG